MYRCAERCWCVSLWLLVCGDVQVCAEVLIWVMCRCPLLCGRVLVCRSVVIGVR